MSQAKIRRLSMDTITLYGRNHGVKSEQHSEIQIRRKLPHKDVRFLTVGETFSSRFLIDRQLSRGKLDFE